MKANDALRMRQQRKVVDTPKVVAPVRLNGARVAVENDLCPVNVAKGIRVRGRKVPEEARLSYGIEDLQKIFSSPVYTDGLRPVGGAGEAAFWLPLLGLWAGSRLEELGQLLVQDVKRSPDGIDYFQVTDQGEGQKLKTKGSRRSVPIHPELIRLGFLRYIDER